MTTLALSTPLLKRISINWKALCFFAFFAFCFLLILHAYLVNQLTDGTYSVKNYESQLANLAKENRSLEVSFAETGFLGNVREKAMTMNFEKAHVIKYINIIDPSVAKK